MKLVEVTFHDAFDLGSGWESYSSARKMVDEEWDKAAAKAVGFILDQDAEKISLAQVWFFNEEPDSKGDCIRGVFVIPFPWIKNIEVLKDYSAKATV